MDRTGSDSPLMPVDPLWYKDAIIYELHVRAFADANGDGIGDFKGLTGRLDYLQDLGVTTLWLLPFYPSPLRDDGYDIADYTTVHPNYGTLDDFKEFLDQAHRRNLRVITELVINHTSDQHPWFQRARRAPPGSVERDFYIWSETPERFKDARIIFQDFEPSNWSWDPIARAYYIHRFYSHQPDLNYDNPAVRAAILPVLDFWVNLGVDGMRLDAIPYLFKREGTTCENLPETHEFLKSLRRHMDTHHPGRMFLAEANQWPEDASAYFGDGDECHMNFHFPLMPRLFMALRLEDRYPIVDILEQTPEIPNNCQWALFLRNHDELTLEMVTDEERDAMLRAYAADPQMRINLGIRRRLGPLLGNDRRRIELMHALLFSLPGTPVMYYGDEIAMGDNVYLGDRNGVRTPMQWSADRNAGFSRANPQRLYLPVIIDPEYHYEANNVEAQQSNPHSLLWWVKRLIALRKQWKAFGRGGLTVLNPDNPRVLAFLRTLPPEQGGERVLVIVNLSRFSQVVELNLGEFQGMTPVELFGQSPFPPVGNTPYRLTLGPHNFFWFALTEPAATEVAPTLVVEDLPALRVTADWTDLLHGTGRRALQERLPAWLVGRPWFRGLGRPVKSARIVEAARLPGADPAVCLAGVRVDFVNGEAETYSLPLAFAPTERVAELAPDGKPLARVVGGSEGVLYDAVHEPAVARAFLGMMAAGARVATPSGELTATLLPGIELPPDDRRVDPVMVGRPERSQIAVSVGDKLGLRVYRRLSEGTHPDLELARVLSASADPPTLPVGGWVEYRGGGAEPVTLAVLHHSVPHQGDAWEYTLAALGRFAEQAVANGAPPPIDASPLGILERVEAGPSSAAGAVGAYLDDARRLGARVAAMHLALAAAGDDKRFAPEPLLPFHRRGIYQSMRNQASRAWQRLARRGADWPEAERPAWQALLDARGDLLARYRRLLDAPLDAKRIRVHGDCHLGQFVRAGNDFLVAHFEAGRPTTATERRLKRPAVVDLVAMLASWRHAAESVLTGEAHAHGRASSTGAVRPEDQARLAPWLQLWLAEVGGAFLREYLTAAAPGRFLSAEPAQREVLLEAMLLDRLVADFAADLAVRPSRAVSRGRTLLAWLRQGVAV
jgi:maltose alpha-D-glucosyltransferase/alpha-amylase